jgi:hypothetical protein
VIPGHPFDVEWDVENKGASPFELLYSWRDSINLSTDATWDAPGSASPDVFLGQISRSTGRDTLGNLTLDPYTEKLNPRVPTSTPAGPYFLIVAVDSSNDLYEGLNLPGEDDIKENNNVLASAPFDVVELSTDLIVEIVSNVPGMVYRGESFDVSFRVTNVGEPTPVAGWNDRISLTNIGMVASALANLVHSGPLGTGESYVVDRTVTVPHTLAPGAYDLTASTDTRNAVVELGALDGNNSASTPSVVTDAATDLIAATFEAPASSTSGESILVRWTVQNVGALDLAPVLRVDKIYLSEDQSLDPQDVLLSTRATTAGLLAGQTGAAMECACTLPLLPPRAGAIRCFCHSTVSSLCHGTPSWARWNMSASFCTSNLTTAIRWRRRSTCHRVRAGIYRSSSSPTAARATSRVAMSSTTRRSGAFRRLLCHRRPISTSHP